MANLLDLELAVVAGSVALGFDAAFFDAAQEEIELRAKLDFSRSTRIIRAGLPGADGPLVGAAAALHVALPSKPRAAPWRWATGRWPLAAGGTMVAGRT